MKYLAALLLVALLTTATVAYPAPAPPPGGGVGTEAPGLFGYTPAPKATPAPVQTTGEKKVGLTTALAKDDKGKNPATVFAPADKIFLVWKDDAAAKGDKVRVVWYSEGAGSSKSKKIYDFTQNLPGPGAFGSSYLVTPGTGLAAGKYRADVYNNKTLATSLKFMIK